jgi:hypothetical protein
MKPIIACLLLLGIGGCSRGRTNNPHPRHDATASWDGTLFIDSIGHVPRRPVTNNIRLRVTLAAAAGTSTLTMQIANPTHVGTAQGNFRDLNAGLPNSSYVAHAAQKPRDSLVVAINPMVDHGAIVLTGTFDSARYRGTWLVTDYAEGLRGHFELRRPLKP